LQATFSSDCRVKVQKPEVSGAARLYFARFLDRIWGTLFSSPRHP
jgi:hypothetical protein